MIDFHLCGRQMRDLVGHGNILYNILYNAGGNILCNAGGNILYNAGGNILYKYTI